MGETTQTVVRTSRESARIFTDYTVKTQELFKRAEEQAEAYRRFFGQWGSFFPWSFPFAGMIDNVTFPFQRQGMRLVETTARNVEQTLEDATFPIAGYAEKNVEEISAR
ncbi:MAG: hypothetical protein M3317_04555, partial [Actinomycetota bacterium]|nr:hypothetical protein [Actinomycetota bacterium]